MCVCVFREPGCVCMYGGEAGDTRTWLFACAMFEKYPRVRIACAQYMQLQSEYS